MQQSNPHLKRHQKQRGHRPLPPLSPQPGQIAFRVVCHGSIIGGLIGPSGSIISQIRRHTSCAVHCQDPVDGADHRVVTVLGSGSPDSGRIQWKSGTVGGDEEDGVGDGEVEMVSAAQEAVIRVLERMWELDGGGGAREGYCGLLADTTQIGAVVGKGGKNIVRMRRESGAHLRILPAPPCASESDELIQITGARFAVEKAVLAVTSCLQEFPPYNKGLTALPTRPISRVPYRDADESSDPHAEFFPHLSSFLAPLTGNCGHARSFAMELDSDGDKNQENKVTQQRVSFRLLCSNGAAGSIIGKGGTIVRALQNETGASIIFAAPLTMSGERIVTVSASENLESRFSPAQKAIVLVFARSIEHEIEKGHTSGSVKDTTVTARLLVASGDVCCLKGDGGGIDSELMDATGAVIQLIEGDRVLDHAQNDVVVQISGDYKNVQNALFQVTGKLRDNLLPNEVLIELRARSPNQMLREVISPDQEASLARGMDKLGLSNGVNGSSSASMHSPKKLGVEHAIPTTDNEVSSMASGSGSELERSLQFLLPREVLKEVGMRRTVEGVSTEVERRRKLPIVANTTVELIISEDLLGSVLGDNGSNVARIREISGAKVEVRNPSPGQGEGVVVISGTPDQTATAQSLLQAFVLNSE